MVVAFVLVYVVLTRTVAVSMFVVSSVVCAKQMAMNTCSWFHAWPKLAHILFLAISGVSNPYSQRHCLGVFRILRDGFDEELCENIPDIVISSLGLCHDMNMYAWSVVLFQVVSADEAIGT